MLFPWWPANIRRRGFMSEQTAKVLQTSSTDTNEPLCHETYSHTSNVLNSMATRRDKELLFVEEKVDEDIKLTVSVDLSHHVTPVSAALHSTLDLTVFSCFISNPVLWFLPSDTWAELSVHETRAEMLMGPKERWQSGPGGSGTICTRKSGQLTQDQGAWFHLNLWTFYKVLSFKYDGFSIYC